MIKWKNLTDESHLDEMRTLSETNAIVIFKHSTRCSISSTAKDRLERNWKENDVPGVLPYFLDLITYRSVSNKIAESFGVEHQSPQVIVIKNGKAVYNTSHMNINFEDIKKQLA